MEERFFALTRISRRGNDMNYRRIYTSLSLGLILLSMTVFSSPTHAEDAVILMDGFTIRGKSFKEKVMSFDALSGPLTFSRLNAFDGVDQGAKYVFFSGHSKKQLAAIEKDLPKETTLEFTKTNPGSQDRRLPVLADMKFSDFGENWRRSIRVNFPDGKYDTIDQQITYISPSRIYITSTTHGWRQAYITKEFSPTVLRMLLGAHPKLKDENGKVNPKRRMLIAEFFQEVGWLTLARSEIAQLKKDAPPPWDKDADAQLVELEVSLDKSETKWVMEELDTALKSGRYEVASKFINDYKPKSPDAKDLAKFSELKARIEILQPRFELAKRLLSEVMARESGMDLRNAHASAAGTGILALLRSPAVPAQKAQLIRACETILTELHPDSISRIEFFIDLADQADKRRMSGKDPGSKGEQLLSLAITGWLKGKAGAEQDTKNAIRCWNTRNMAIQYLREDGQNNRTIMLKKYLGSTDELPPDELAQIMTLLPPIEPEDLKKLRETALDTKETEGIAQIYKRKTGSAPADGNVQYALRLPPEYHHGRSYPLIIAIPHPTLSAEKMVAGLALEAAKNGYIVAALDWKPHENTYTYSGDEHRDVQALLREMSRNFCVDQDKVFLFGFGEGANFALDMGLSHPDLFAGVIPMCPNIVWPFYQEFWRNAQKLPVYAVIGEVSGSAFTNLRNMYEKWLPLGFPGILTVYKGRSTEWYAYEIPTIFDWMNRKTRVRGTASLRLNSSRFEAWQSLRESDKRYYWIEFTSTSATNTMKPGRPQTPPYPAQCRADIKKGNEIVIEDTRGVKTLTIWLERDMIDWTSPVNVKISNSKTRWKPEILKPNLSVMFENLYRTGDRKMLFFGKLEFELF